MIQKGYEIIYLSELSSIEDIMPRKPTFFNTSSVGLSCSEATPKWSRIN